MSEEIKEGYTRVSDFFKRYEDFSSIDPEVLKNKARIGTNVHKAIECSANYIPYELQPDEEGYFKSWQIWHVLMHCNILETETRLYCDKLKITGAIDGVVRFAGDETKTKYIVDWKTSSSSNDDIWSLKATFYHHLAQQNNLCGVSDKVMYVQLDKDGGRPVIHEYEITKNLKGLMIAVIMSHRFEEKVKSKKR